VKVKIFLSFDHEISLGSSPSYFKDLFEPTEELLKLVSDLQVPINLFTDILCAKRFIEWDSYGFYNPWKKQIHLAFQQGNDVQLHIHPHWIDTKYIKNRFVPAKNFNLASFRDREKPNDIPGIIKQSVEFLTKTMHEIDLEYKCVAFRAGGFGISPETGIILSSLYNNGIRIDSSLAEGLRFESEISQIDFHGLPKKANWYLPFTDFNIHFDKSENGIFEIPIASYPRTAINNIPFLIKRVLLNNRRSYSIGKGIHEENTSLYKKIKRLFPNSAWTFGFDNNTYTLKTLKNILQYYLKEHSADEYILVSSVSHPKSMGKYARSLMEQFIKMIQDEYINIEFTTYSKIVSELEL
jgi:hypothetical protein